MRSIQAFVVTVTAVTMLCASAGASPNQEQALVRMRIPHVIPTADELANPHLYHPYEGLARYIPRPFDMPPPPENIVRPAEFDPMDSTIITVMNYGPAFIDMWVEMTRVFSAEAHTYIIARDDGLRSTLDDRLKKEGIDPSTYSYLTYPTDSIWIRDYGPEFVVDESGERHIIDKSYAGRPLDDYIPNRMGISDWINSDGSEMPVHYQPHGLSGGNLMTDGAGTCFLSDIVYDEEKPSNWTKDDVDNFLKIYLGCEQIIILRPLCLDGTGHIDLYAKIVGPTSILLVQFPEDTTFHGESAVASMTNHCDDKFVNDYADMEHNLQVLRSTTNLKGEPWQITRIPMLEPYSENYFGQKSWVYRSYLNSEIIGKRVAMPSYYVPQLDYEDADYLLDVEAQAIAAYEAANPDLIEVAPIPSDHIIDQAGAIHCISHEIPAESGGWTPPAEYCGNSIAEGDEECDGTDQRNTTCADLGYKSGKIRCDGYCKFVTENCIGAPPVDTDEPADTDEPVDTEEQTDAEDSQATAPSVSTDEETDTGARFPDEESDEPVDTSMPDEDTRDAEEEPGTDSKGSSGSCSAAPASRSVALIELLLGLS